MFERRKEARRRVEEDEADFRAAFGVQSTGRHVGRHVGGRYERERARGRQRRDDDDAGRHRRGTRGVAVGARRRGERGGGALCQHRIERRATRVLRRPRAPLQTRPPDARVLGGERLGGIRIVIDDDGEPGDDSRTPEACGDAAKKALRENSEDDGSLVSTLLLRAFILAGGKVDDRAFFDDLTKALVAAHAYASMRGGRGGGLGDGRLRSRNG